jgi:hypothetical protein
MLIFPEFSSILRVEQEKRGKLKILKAKVRVCSCCSWLNCISMRLSCRAPGPRKGIEAETPQDLHGQIRGVGAESPVFWPGQKMRHESSQRVSRPNFEFLILPPTTQTNTDKSMNILKLKVRGCPFDPWLNS